MSRRVVFHSAGVYDDGAGTLSLTTWKGAWSGATAYVVGDAVSSGGSSYVCVLAHTNHVPPNGTYWDVLAPAASDVAAATHAASSKTPPVDADELPLADSAASFTLAKLTWANLKATLKTHFDTLYAAVGSTGSSAHILLADGHATPFAFTDLLQMDDGSDFMWSE